MKKLAYLCLALVPGLALSNNAEPLKELEEKTLKSSLLENTEDKSTQQTADIQPKKNNTDSVKPLENKLEEKTSTSSNSEDKSNKAEKTDELKKKDLLKVEETNKEATENSNQESAKSPEVDPDAYVPLIKKEVSNPVFINNADRVINLKKDVKMREVFYFTFNSYWLVSGLATVFENGDTIVEVKYLDQDFLNASNPDNFIKIDNKVYLFINNEYISLLNEENLNIEAVLPQEYFKPQVLELSKANRNHAEPITATYFNYALAGDPNDLNTVAGNFDFNIATSSNWLLRNTFAMDTARNFYRGSSVLMKEFPNKYSLMIGDISSSRMNDFSSVNIFGLRLSSPYFTSPNNNENTLQSLEINGYSINPGKLDIYLNDRLYKTTQVTTGNYNLTIPKMDNSGFGIAKAVTYDKLGQPIIVEIPFFADIELVKAGAFEYELTAGLISDPEKNPTFAYGTDPSFSGQFLYGVTDNYTQKLFFTYSDVYSAIGGTSIFLAGKTLGKLSFDWGANTFNQTYLSFDYQANPFKDLMLGAKHSRAITGEAFCYGYTNSCLTSSTTLSASLKLGDFGNLSFNHNDIRNTMGNAKATSIQFNKQLTDKLTFSAGASQSSNSFSPIVNKSLSFVLSYNFGQSSLSSSSQTNNGNTTYQTTFNVNENIDKPWYGYGSITNTKTSTQSNYNAAYGANLSMLAYNINANQGSDGKISYAGTLSGGAYYVPSVNKFGLSKNISTGLALVEVTNPTGPVSIMHENKHSGFTDKRGFYAVPNVSPNNQETISININELPRNMIVEEHSKDVVVPSNGAFTIKFAGSANPFMVRIYGVEEGTLITMDEDLYVVGSKGRTTVAKEGPLKIEYEPGKFCELNIKRGTKNYYCGNATPENKFPNQAKTEAEKTKEKEKETTKEVKPETTKETTNEVKPETTKEESFKVSMLKKSSWD